MLSEVITALEHINLAIREQCVQIGGHSERERIMADVGHEHQYHCIQWIELTKRWVYVGQCQYAPNRDVRDWYLTNEVVVRVEDMDILKVVLQTCTALLDVWPGEYMALALSRTSVHDVRQARVRARQHVNV